MTQNSTSSSTCSSQAAAMASSLYSSAERSKPSPLDTCVRSESRLQVINLRPSVSCESLLPVPVHSLLSPLPPLTGRQTASSWHLSPAPLRKSWAPGSCSDDHVSLPDSRTASVPAGSSLAERVAIMMARTDYPPEVLAKIESYKQKLNTSSAEWMTLCLEDDACVLSALMWDWIDELKVSTTARHFLYALTCAKQLAEHKHHAVIVSNVSVSKLL